MLFTNSKSIYPFSRVSKPVPDGHAGHFKLQWFVGSIDKKDGGGAVGITRETRAIFMVFNFR